jgi:hypothetical protein
MWSQRAIHHSGVLGAGQVWNYHLIEQPEVVYRLGCEWNAQLGGSKFGLPVSGWIRTETRVRRCCSIRVRVEHSRLLMIRSD